MFRKLLPVLVFVLAVLIGPVDLAADSIAPSVSAATPSEPLVFVVLSVPCRFYDSRSPLDTIAANEIKVIPTDPDNSSLQGGEIGCGITSDTAKAVRINVKGRSTTASSGYFRIFNADASAVGNNYSSLQLQGPDRFVAIELDVPISGTSSIAIHSIVEAHAVVDLIGYYVPQE